MRLFDIGRVRHGMGILTFLLGPAGRYIYLVSLRSDDMLRICWAGLCVVSGLFAQWSDGNEWSLDIMVCRVCRCTVRAKLCSCGGGDGSDWVYIPVETCVAM